MRNFRVYVNGVQYEVGVEEVFDNNPSTEQNNSSYATEKKSEPIVEAKSASQPKLEQATPIQVIDNTQGHSISAPFPGVILKSLKSNGEKVKKGEVIFVLEAMKMENDIASPADGVISVNVQAGSNVETGAILAIVS